MFDIGNDRAPGPDGYTSTFFKKGWDIVGFDVCNAIGDFFTNGQILKEINHTFLALIPKVSTPFRVNDYRPISCCNVIYKCISKILTNRIIEGIKEVVSENQSAFVPGRRVRLSDTFKYHKHCEDLQVINVCFADDLFIFSRGDVDSAKVIMDSLEEFKRTSGLVPSIRKSTTFFCNVLNHVKLAILNIMPFSEGGLLVKYLGVPLISSRLLNKDCKILVEKAKNRIGDWKNKLLSFVAELESNGGWVWPQSWLLKAPNLGLVPAPNLNTNRFDVIRWRDNNGNITDFSVKCAWEALRPRGITVAWHRVVWFSHCIPRHAFHLWLVMRRSLKTQDKMRQWDVGGGTDLNLLRCSLCDSQPDSHEHLFFECAFSSQPMANQYTAISVLERLLLAASTYYVWLERNNRIFKKVKRTPEEIIDIIMFYVLGRLLLAASTYYVWLERNNRIFKKVKRTPEEIIDIIMVTVHLKLLTFRFKNTNMVNKLLSRWKMPTSFRLYGGHFSSL
ncbi:reverse transcriptase domain, reverse transcriptase zinc-binding domain protein [Tanacetum coccineum]|uniref:Reverse transcriptase domain, reverse transcriptase zinc-binding domain protein n=1 Tax=Tanacetum coccineum TaxID=301880 RepID=A0ABQ5IMC0_9ASTR